MPTWLTVISATLVLFCACADEIQHIDSPYSLAYRTVSSGERVQFDSGGTLFYHAATATVTTWQRFPLNDMSRQGFWLTWDAVRVEGAFTKAGTHEGSAGGGMFGSAHGCPEFQLYDLTLTYAVGGTSSTWQGEPPGCD